MLFYPVDVIEDSPGKFTAKLVDLAAGPVGRGHTARAAYEKLATVVVPVLTDLMLRNAQPTPSEVGDRMAIGLDPPMGIVTPPDSEVIGEDRKRGAMMNYSWSNDIVFRDK